AQTYLELDLRRNSQATRQGREYVERERSRTQSELAAASASLAAYKQASGMIAPSAQVNEVAAASARLRNELHAARAEDKAARLKLADLTAQLRSTASEVDYQRTVAENPEYATVRASILELQKELAKVSQVFAPGSPERTDVENQIEAAEKRLERLSAKTVSGQTTQRNPVLVQLQTQYSATKADAIVAAAKKSAVEAQARSVSQELMKYPEQERRFAELQQRVDVLKSTYEMLSQRYYSLLIEERSSLPGGMIAAQAEANFEPSSPNVKRNLILGLFLALVFGVAAGLVSDHLDNKIHRAEDIERLTGLATLALVPEVESPNTEDGNLYVGKAAPQHAFLEAFRMLRNNIGFSMPDRSLKTIAVTSSTMGEGKSTVASNLAIAMAMDRKRVLLVDADLRKPTVHTKMHVSKELGLSSVISGTASLAEAIRSTEWDGLDCLPAGPLPPDPTEFLNSARCRQVLSEAQGQYDYIVLDAPPCIGISDMQVISTLADGVAIVVALDQATKPQLLMSYRMIQQSGAKVIGSAVNRVSLRSHGYYGYYGYYGYGDGENVGTSAGRSKHS
ncbi:MAG TPA: polysaccharide biosynthesis tyrosine autokinase, partial [Fimbriimonas sp.]